MYQQGQHPQGGPAQGPQGGGGQPNFMGNVNPQMLNLGMETTSNMLKTQRDKYMPGVSNFWNSLKLYFMVNNTYVQKKLMLLLFPFKNKDWSRKSSDDASVSLPQDEGSTHKWLPPKYDVNAPDLYIPCMAFSTYILLVGFSNGQSNKFTPEALVQAVYSCLIFQIFETLIFKFGVSTLLQVHLPFLDLYSYTGYKYVGLCLCMLSSLLGTTIYFLFSLYTSVSVSYFVLKSMSVAVPSSNVNTSGPPRHVVLLGFAATQLLVNFILCYL